MADTGTTRLVSIRVDFELKNKLETAAAESDRSVTQLCRYALGEFLLSGVVLSALPKLLNEDSGLTELIGVRLSEDLLSELENLSEDKNFSTSAALRQILQWWFASADLSILGRPAQALLKDKAGR